MAWHDTSLAMKHHLAQSAKCYRELRQYLGNTNFCVSIGLLQVQDFSCKCVPTRFRTAAKWEQNVSIVPDSGSDWREIDVIEQACD